MHQITRLKYKLHLRNQIVRICLCLVRDEERETEEITENRESRTQALPLAAALHIASNR